MDSISPNGSPLKTCPQTVLSFTKNTSTLVYCNHPEQLYSTAFGDSNLGNHFLNQVSVTTSTAMVYASYQVQGTAGKFGIQIFNPTTSTATITRRNYGFSTGTGVWDTMPRDVWVQYFANAGGNQYQIPPNGNVWIMEQSFGANDIFNAVQRFEMTGAPSVIVTVYAYSNKNNLNGTATACPQGAATQCSGYGSSNYISANVTIKASDLNAVTGTYPNPKSKRFTLIKWYPTNSKPMIESNTNEIVGITSVQGPAVSIDSLGNWGVQYY
ncbi:MAG: hypothetical protein LBC21_05625, partial [Oscillospiraceae bacterium]|nr:hypothetical protein [Oscillospiraceae bacterium]